MHSPFATKTLPTKQHKVLRTIYKSKQHIADPKAYAYYRTEHNINVFAFRSQWLPNILISVYRTEFKSAICPRDQFPIIIFFNQLFFVCLFVCTFLLILIRFKATQMGCLYATYMKLMQSSFCLVWARMNQ